MKFAIYLQQSILACVLKGAIVLFIESADSILADFPFLEQRFVLHDMRVQYLVNLTLVAPLYELELLVLSGQAEIFVHVSQMEKSKVLVHGDVGRYENRMKASFIAQGHLGQQGLAVFRLRCHVVSLLEDGLGPVYRGLQLGILITIRGAHMRDDEPIHSPKRVGRVLEGLQILFQAIRIERRVWNYHLVHIA